MNKSVMASRHDLRRTVALGAGVAVAAGALLGVAVAPAQAANHASMKPTRAIRVLDTTPPPAPTGLQAAVYPSSSEVILKWSAVKASDLAGYLVYRSDSTPVVLDAAHLRSTATPFNALQLPDYPPFTGAAFHYVVVAVDTSGNRSASAPLSVTTTDRTPPPAPTGVTGSADPVAGTYTVSWNPATDPDTAGYRIANCDPDFITCFMAVSDPPMPRSVTSVTYPWPAGEQILYRAVCAEDAHFVRACTRVTVQAAS